VIDDSLIMKFAPENSPTFANDHGPCTAKDGNGVGNALDDLVHYPMAT
jgi:hypothetical protein